MIKNLNCFTGSLCLIVRDATVSKQAESLAVAWFVKSRFPSWAQIWAHFLKSYPYFAKQIQRPKPAARRFISPSRSAMPAHDALAKASCSTFSR
jgi:hypothetical protein